MSADRLQRPRPKHNPFRLQCRQCQRWFQNLSGLTQHRNAAHPVPPSPPHEPTRVPLEGVEDRDEPDTPERGGVPEELRQCSEERGGGRNLLREEHPYLNGKYSR